MGHEPGNRYFAVPDRCGDLIEIAPGGVTAADHRHQEQSRDRASLTRPFANTAHDLSCRDAVPIVKCRQSTGVQKLVGKGDLPKGGCHALAHKQCGDTFTQSAYDGVVFRHHHQPASLARGRKNSLIVQLRLPRIVCRTQPSSPKPVGRQGGPGIPWSAFLRPSNGEFAGKAYVFVSGEKWKSETNGVLRQESVQKGPRKVPTSSSVAHSPAGVYALATLFDIATPPDIRSPSNSEFS